MADYIIICITQAHMVDFKPYLDVSIADVRFAIYDHKFAAFSRVQNPEFE